MSGSWWDGRRVLVAGGAGFIGSHLVELLLKVVIKKVPWYRANS